MSNALLVISWLMMFAFGLAAGYCVHQIKITKSLSDACESLFDNLELPSDFNRGAQYVIDRLTEDN